MSIALRTSLPPSRAETGRNVGVDRSRLVDAAGREPSRRADEPGAGTQHPSARPEPSRSRQSLAGLTVVVVDDDEASAEYFALALRTEGANVVTAASAVEALRAVQERRPDVVLSDIAMPIHDGYWLVREIRGLGDPALRRVPVVATTAYGHAHAREQTLAAGFVDHLPKPVEPERLWAAIGRAAGRGL